MNFIKECLRIAIMCGIGNIIIGLAVWFVLAFIGALQEANRREG